jgi:hypothetical protein
MRLIDDDDCLRNGVRYAQRKSQKLSSDYGTETRRYRWVFFPLQVLDTRNKTVDLLSPSLRVYDNPLRSRTQIPED